MHRKINFDYLNIWKEIPLFCLLELWPRRQTANNSGNTLIVIPSLVGEFAACAPALRDFIERNPGKHIDLVVSPPLQKLAQHIIGVRHVFTTASVFARKSEKEGAENHFGSYERTIVLRMSPSAYRLLKTVSVGRIETGLWHMSRYALHLAKEIVLGRTPKRFGDINFEMLGSMPRPVPFDTIFHFNESDYNRIKALPILQTSQKKIVIHTGASWIMNKWSNERWVELLKKLRALGDFRFIFVGTKDDEKDYAYIASKVSFETHSLAGKTNLLELLLTLRLCDYFIGIDSGPRNLAHLAGLRSITLLGPGPHMYTPPDPRDVVIDKSRGRGLYERFVATKQGTIDRITPEEVVEAFKKIFGD